MRYLHHALAALSVWLLPMTANAADTPEEFLQDIGQETEYQTETPLPEMIGGIIHIFLSIIGVVMVVLMVYGGYLWMTARGNDDQVKKARETIQNAVIGIVIVFLAWSLSNFVIRGLIQATLNTPR